VQYCKISAELRRGKIPYIIVTRGALTNSAQNNKKNKKKIGNLVLFNKFVKNALAIQYLTLQEYKDSGDKWNKRHLIIPNGITKKENIKTYEYGTTLKGIFIGRPDVYQKGIDIFLEACKHLKSELLEKNCIIEIYGPDILGGKEKIEKIISENELNDIVVQKNAVFDLEKEKVLLSSDFFILTSRFEGHPMGLIEALSFGLPSLVTTGSNMSDEIRENDAGWTADISVESIAENLLKVLNEKELFQQKGINAVELSKKYDWNYLSQISNEEYKKLLNI